MTAKGSGHIWIHRPEEGPDFYRQLEDYRSPIYRWGVRLFWMLVPIITGLVLFERWGWL